MQRSYTHVPCPGDFTSQTEIYARYPGYPYRKIKYNMPEYKEGCLSFTTNTYTYFLLRRFSHTWLECDPTRLRMRKASQCNEVLRLEGGDVFSYIFFTPANFLYGLYVCYLEIQRKIKWQLYIKTFSYSMS